MKLLKELENIDKTIIVDNKKLMQTEIEMADLYYEYTEYEKAKEYYNSALERMEIEGSTPFVMY